MIIETGRNFDFVDFFRNFSQKVEICSQNRSEFVLEMPKLVLLDNLLMVVTWEIYILGKSSRVTMLVLITN